MQKTFITIDSNMDRRNKLLFWGSLPPSTVNGISISSQINLRILNNIFQVDSIEDEDSFQYHDKLSLFKIKLFLKSYLAILKKSYRIPYKYFYLVFSLSTLGGIKTLLAIVSFRLLNSGKIVLHIHRGDFFSHFHKGIINKIISSTIIKLTHKILVLSEITKVEFENKSIHKCVVLHNTVEIDYKSDYKENKKLKFLYISNYLIDKGIFDLLEVFSKLCIRYPAIILQTYGAFSDQSVKKEILSYSSSNIQIFDSITGIEKFEKIAQSDCLILPSWNEGQPIILLEAMSIGTPVIATRVGLIPDLLGTDYPFLADARDQFSLENIVIQFMQSERINEISTELKEKYDRIYSKKKHREDLINIFTIA